jgi:hypothetical protein
VIVSGTRRVPLMPTFPNLLPSSATSLIARDVQRLVAGFRNPTRFKVRSACSATSLAACSRPDVVWLHGRSLTQPRGCQRAGVDSEARRQRSVAAADATRRVFPAPGTFRKILTLGNEGRSWYRALQVKSRSLGGRRTGDRVVYALAGAGHGQLRAAGRQPQHRRRDGSRLHRRAAQHRRGPSPGRFPDRARWSAAVALGHRRGAQQRPYTVSWGDDRNGTTQKRPHVPATATPARPDRTARSISRSRATCAAAAWTSKAASKRSTC